MAANNRPESYPLKQKIHLTGTVVKGFGRGGKELGIPTGGMGGGPALLYGATDADALI